LFIVLGLALFIAAGREKIGASGKELPDTKTGIWALLGIGVFLLALFFGGIIVRRAYDIAWVPLVTGFIAGAAIFLLSESERRYYQLKASGSIR
jgi:di/tricarboxylate transporter